MAPKASGRIVPYEGLPLGWQAIEKDYLTGILAGKSYIRFQNEKHKGVGSVRAALKLYAADNDMDPDQVIADFDQQREAEKAKAKADKEAKGFLEGDKRDEAVAHFRNLYGKLDGATVSVLPGWRGESKWLEKSQQICARYYAPDGQAYGLLCHIEALFGIRLMKGEEIPDIEAARASLATDENGKVINMARRDNLASDFTVGAERPVKKKRTTVSAIAAENDYRETEFLKVLRLRTPASSDALEEEKVADKEQLLQDVEQIHRALVGRGFGAETELLYVTGSRNLRTVGRKALDNLRGIYYQRPDEYCGRACYQRVFTAENSNALGCRGLFMSWSDSQQLWKIGQLCENKAGFAVCREAKPHPADVDALWSLYDPRVEGAEGGDGDGVENGAAGGDSEGTKQDSQDTNHDTAN